MNPFYGTFLSNCSFVHLWLTSSKKLRSFSVKTRKASKVHKDILTCALQSGCSKTGKILGKSLCRIPVLETLSCNFIKTGLHHWHFPRKLPNFFGQTFHKNTSEQLIWKGVQLFSKPSYYCFGRATVEV